MAINCVSDLTSMGESPARERVPGSFARESDVPAVVSGRREGTTKRRIMARTKYLEILPILRRGDMIR